jgi:hypothetical protein
VELVCSYSRRDACVVRQINAPAELDILRLELPTSITTCDGGEDGSDGDAHAGGCLSVDELRRSLQKMLIAHHMSPHSLMNSWDQSGDGMLSLGELLGRIKRLVVDEEGDGSAHVAAALRIAPNLCCPSLWKCLMRGSFAGALRTGCGTRQCVLLSRSASKS